MPARGLRILLQDDKPGASTIPRLSRAEVSARLPISSRAERPSGAPDPGPQAVAPRIASGTLDLLLEQRATQRREEVDLLRDKRRPEVAQENLPLAAYLLARTVDGRSVEGQDLQRLVNANDTIVETRLRLRYGKGNLRPDIERTGHDSTRRVVAARTLFDKMSFTSAFQYHAEAAAVAMHSQAGNCGEHAHVALALHGGRTTPGETLRMVAPGGVDHLFMEASIDARRDHDVIVDAWADGPAIMASDGRFAVPLGAEEAAARDPSSKEARPDVRFELASGTAGLFAAHVEHRLEESAPLRTFAFESILHAVHGAGYEAPSDKCYDAPISVLSNAFQHRVTARMDARVTPHVERPGSLADNVRNVFGTLVARGAKPDVLADIRPQIVAAGAARNLGSSVASAVEDAAAIVQEARRLLTPLSLSPETSEARARSASIRPGSRAARSP